MIAHLPSTPSVGSSPRVRGTPRAAAAKNIDDLAELWASTVDALGDEIDPADYEDCSRIYRREEERLAP